MLAAWTRPADAGRPAPSAETRATADTRAAILAAARARLLADGYANLSTRRVAEAAERSAQPDPLPLRVASSSSSSRSSPPRTSGSSSARRRCTTAPEPLWVRWELACDFLEADLASGYVRILQEMIAAGWSDPAVAASVRELIGDWFRCSPTSPGGSRSRAATSGRSPPTRSRR